MRVKKCMMNKILFLFLFVSTTVFAQVEHGILVGGGISLCIEIIQLPFSVRASDVDDLILNTAGGVLGYWCYMLLIGRRRKKR